MQKGRAIGKRLAQRGTELNFGTFACKALESTWMTARQIESARVAITRVMERKGNLWIRIFPDKPITKKPAEVRMGKGKGALDHYVVVIKPGRILFEIDGVSEEMAKKAVRKAGHKLPIKVKFVIRRDYNPNQ